MPCTACGAQHVSSGRIRPLLLLLVKNAGDKMDTFQKRIKKNREVNKEPVVKFNTKKLIAYAIIFFSIIIGMGACQLIVNP
jgi:hypothetical protein